MTMKIINKTEIPRMKTTDDMDSGEVCYLTEEECYVLKVFHPGQQPIFLILGDDDEGNTYGYNCGHEARELKEGESITIRFSK